MFDQRSAPPTTFSWSIHEQKTGLLAAVVFGIFASYLILYVGVTVSRPQTYPFGDFFALWSYAKFLLSHPAAQIYDSARLHAEQIALGMDPADQNPFPYPPIFLLILSPLGFLPYRAAYTLWMLATLLLYLLALRPERHQLGSTLITIIAPTTTITIIMGQSGFLAAALLIGGLRLAGKRPLIAGVLLGLLFYKPQLGILVPVALLAAGAWRAVLSAGATIVGLVIVTSFAFGRDIWPSWIDAVLAYSSQFDAEAAYKLMPTITANLQMLGASPSIARLIQGIAALCVMAIVWASFRRGITPLAVATLLVGTFLATPHAFLYDLPILTAGIFYFIRDRIAAEGVFGSDEIATLILGMVFPAVMIWAGPTVPISPLPEVLLLGLIVTRHGSSLARLRRAPGS